MLLSVGLSTNTEKLRMAPKKRPIENYPHSGKERLNNPPIGLVTPDTDQDVAKKTYAYDPRLDLQLAWGNKAEPTSFKIATVSLHVHAHTEPQRLGYIKD